LGLPLAIRREILEAVRSFIYISLSMLISLIRIAAAAKMGAGSQKLHVRTFTGSDMNPEICKEMTHAPQLERK
jgi:hypothetical protein